jgi:hypothetical protein
MPFVTGVVKKFDEAIRAAAEGVGPGSLRPGSAPAKKRDFVFFPSNRSARVRCSTLNASFAPGFKLSD